MSSWITGSRGKEFEINEFNIPHKYVLQIISDMQLAGIKNKSVVEIRYQCFLKKYDKALDDYDIQLLTFDNTILKQEDEALSDMHALSVQLQKAFNELELKVNMEGKVLKVLNIGEIKNKWQITKEQMLKWRGADTNLQQIFSL